MLGLSRTTDEGSGRAKKLQIRSYLHYPHYQTFSKHDLLHENFLWQHQRFTSFYSFEKFEAEFECFDLCFQYLIMNLNKRIQNGRYG